MKGTGCGWAVHCPLRVGSKTKAEGPGNTILPAGVEVGEGALGQTQKVTTQPSEKEKKDSPPATWPILLLVLVKAMQITQAGKLTVMTK